MSLTIFDQAHRDPWTWPIAEEYETPYSVKFAHLFHPSGEAEVLALLPDGWIFLRFTEDERRYWPVLSEKVGVMVDAWHEASPRGRGPNCFSQSGLEHQLRLYVEHVYVPRPV